jgi:hypothetical protein
MVPSQLVWGVFDRPDVDMHAYRTKTGHVCSDYPILLQSTGFVVYLSSKISLGANVLYLCICDRGRLTLNVLLCSDASLSTFDAYQNVIESP